MYRWEKACVTCAVTLCLLCQANALQCEAGHQCNCGVITGKCYCNKCPLYAYKQTSFSCYNSQLCATCPSGYASDRSEGTACQKCDPGTSTEVLALGCSECGVGKYAPDSGMTACLTCGAGMFSGTTGATSCATCQTCPGGYITQCSPYNDAECKPLPSSSSSQCPISLHHSRDNECRVYPVTDLSATPLRLKL
jgi:hypothetical protein